MMASNRKLKMGMVGGGPGAFIGGVHRMAAALDGQIELVCGAFSSRPERSVEAGAALFLAPERCYPDFLTMVQAEAARPEGERMDFVSIVTPNCLHLAAARAALDHGFHVVSDQPATLNLHEAWQLQDAVDASGRLYVLTQNYSGYPMVRVARELVESGALGELRKVVVEYSQGWMHHALAAEGSAAEAWRQDPARAGAAGAMADLGSHAHELLEFVTGLRIEELCADLSRFVPGRELDDDGTVLLRFHGGAKGVLLASQIATGEENRLGIRVYGSEAGLEWNQQKPNCVWLRRPDQPPQQLRAGAASALASGESSCRLPAKHPEGFIAAFAQVYRDTAAAIRAWPQEGERGDDSLLPGIAEGVRGMAFIQAAVQSANQGAVWTPLPQRPQRENHD